MVTMTSAAWAISFVRGLGNFRVGSEASFAQNGENGTGPDDALLGMPGFGVLAVTDDGDELLAGIETIRRAAGCPSLGGLTATHPEEGDALPEKESVRQVHIRRSSVDGRSSRLVKPKADRPGRVGAGET